MHRKPTLAVVLICLPSLALAGKSQQSGSTPKQYTIEQLLKNVRVSGPRFSADESKVLYSSNVTGVKILEFLDKYLKRPGIRRAASG